ncbi:MAG: hypothetical protein MN733_29010 [Nitrososphaera sp.]|nr:hypothetical protein [Nitrososphaera sp.]
MSGRDWIKLLVKYKGKCSQCGREINQGEYALWSRTAKAIKHERCEVQAAPAGERVIEPLEVENLDCFICGNPAGCAECGFEADCNRAIVSQACICNQCMADKRAFENYQQAFMTKMRKVAKVKI